MKNISLKKRLLLAAALILITFLSLAGFALDRAFISSAEVSLQSQLRTQTLGLLSVLEVDSSGNVVLPRRLPEARFDSPNSGLYAVILDANGEAIWRSESTLGVHIENLRSEKLGAEIFQQTGETLSSPFRFSFAFSWETEQETIHEFTLIVIESSNQFVVFVSEHRQKIILWLGLVGLFLLILQVIALNWSLSPLTKVMEEMDHIEHAKQDQILGTYPDEIAILSQRINLLITNERKNIVRYRNMLDDLAHSLKTPLTVLKGLSESETSINPQELNGYVDRMSNIVEYQLKRAATTQVSLVHRRISVLETVKSLEAPLQKVYAYKNIRFSDDIPTDVAFYGDQADLYELLGNVMDNACKFARAHVSCRANMLEQNNNWLSGIKIVVEDDGEGIDGDVKELVLQRGMRADQQTDGQGIGLAICREIIDRYNGTLELNQSVLGGAAICITLSPASQPN